MNRISYSNAIRSMMYLMVYAGSDLAHAINTLSRFMTNPSPNHWEALKLLLKYLKGTYNVSLVYKHYTDSVTPHFLERVIT